MKTVRRMVSLLLAMIVVLGMSCTVMASGSTPPALPEPPKEQSADMKGHTFKAYQIFKGTTVPGEKGAVAEDTLKEIQWGDHIYADAFLAALQKSTEFGSSNPFAGITYDKNASYKSAEKVINVLGDPKKGIWPSDTINENQLIAAATDGKLRAFARIADANKKTGSGVEEGKNLAPGFYLVVDETELDQNAENTARNLSFLQVSTGMPFTMVNKTDVPELEKKVLEVNDSTGVQSWQDTADYDIGDDVTFVLIGRMPSDYASYQNYYHYVFHDTLSAGLGVPKEIKVKIGGKEVPSGYTAVHTPATGSAVPAAGGSAVNGAHMLEITFDNLKEEQWEVYHITAGTVITVEYKAELLPGAVLGGTGNENKAYLEYSNNPNYTGDGSPNNPPPPPGRTPEDKVIVLSYQLVVNKQDKDGKALSGAGFSLYKYDKAADKYVSVNTEGSTLVKEEDLDGNPEYYEIKGEDITTFSFKGVDQGDYKLVESTVPAGYNRADDMYFTVRAEYDEKQDPPALTKLKITNVKDKDGNPIITDDGSKKPVFSFTGKTDDGSLNADVINLKGRRIPSTGGIGTTIFYAAGSIMAIGAGVILVVRRRIRKNKE